MSVVTSGSVRGRIGALALLACAWLALAANAYAAPTWLPPEDIAGPTESITFPEIAVNSAGDAVAIWPKDIGSNNVIEVLERPAGGKWSDPEVISDSGEEGPSNVHIGLDAAGNAVAVWNIDLGSAIRTAVRPAGGDWSAPENLFTNGGESPSFAMNDVGDAVAVWTGHNGIRFVTWVAVRQASGGWSAPEELANDGEEQRAPEVEMDATGNAIAVWQLVDPGENEIRAAVRPADGDWSAPDPLSTPGENAQSPRVAMNAAGDAIVVWSVVTGDIQAAFRPSGGDWTGTPEVVSEQEGAPELAIDSDGNAFATWPTGALGERILQVAMRPLGGEWSEPEDLSAEFDGFRSYELEASPAAGVVATWTWREGTFPSEENGIQAAVRPPSGVWSEPEEISTEGENSGLPELGFDAAGNAVAIWGREAAASEYFLQGAGYDFSGPQLNGLQIPAAGTVGEPILFAVSPFDVFSLGATSWTFGDGSPAASGNAAFHVYTAPGTYPVTVNAVDGSGNVSTQTAGITITAKPTPPPPGKIDLSLRLETVPLGRLLRKGRLAVFATVNEPAWLVLRGKARLRVPGPKGPRVKLVSIFKMKTVTLTAPGEREVKLRLSRRGRALLRGRTKARIVIAGKATNASAETARHTLSQILQR